MNFVWLLGSGSNYNDEEIRYSIRSVLKFHPESTVTIIGECPDWYTGSHYYIPDGESPYINTWNKALKACELFDEWIVMNDDFYLLAPYEKRFYFSGTLKAHARRVGSVGWGKLVQSTYKAFPDSHRWTVHAPCPIISKEFIALSEKHKGEISWKTMYCHLTDYFEKVELAKDVKIRGTIKREIKTPFFSIANNFGRNRGWFEEQYPLKCKYEK